MLPKLVKQIRYFFGISKTEANGVVVLILIMVLIAAGSILISSNLSSGNLSEQEVNHLDSMAAQIDNNFYFDENTELHNSHDNESDKLFPFDPNKATYQDFISLGIGAELSNRILKYRTNGGNFDEKADLKKIYGLSETIFLRLEPFIKIQKVETPITVADEINNPDFEWVNEDPGFTKFDINEVDSSELLIIKGIGKTISSRIVRFRNKLGGFVRIDQLREVYGLDDYAYDNLQSQSFIDEDFQPRAILVNEWSADSLANHPYIDYKKAKVIEAYRKQHGIFNEPTDLLEIVVVDSTWVGRLIPYLKF